VIALQEEERALTSLTKRCPTGKYCLHPDETEPEPDVKKGPGEGPRGTSLTPEEPAPTLEPKPNVEQARVFFAKEGVGAKSPFVNNGIYVKTVGKA